MQVTSQSPAGATTDDLCAMIVGAGEKLTLPKQIVQEFGEFYITLYNLHLGVPKQSAMDEYLAPSGMTGLTTSTQQELESPITLEEIDSTK